MNGGLVPLLLISLTVGLMLGACASRSIAVAAAGLVFAAVASFVLPLLFSVQTVFIGLWLSVIVTALSVYLPGPVRCRASVPLAINAGAWAGACAAQTASATGLAIGLLPVLAAVPAYWLVRRKFDIAVKVVASWMIAISALSMFVSLMPTPGYKPDHME
jgi:hypothetical protein